MDKKNSNQVDFLYIFRVFLSYWYLFAVSGIIFVGLGLMYYRYAPKTYAVYSKIALNSEQVNRARSSNTFVNINELMDEEQSVRDQIAYMRSTPLLEEVIRDLNLSTTYYIQEDKIPKEVPLGYRNIYKNSPFIVIINQEHPQPVGMLFYMQIIDENSFFINASEKSTIIYDFKNSKPLQMEANYEIDGTYRFGEEIQTSKSSFTILLNSNYNAAEYKGKDLFFKFSSPKALAERFNKALSIGSAYYESSIINLNLQWDNVELAKVLLTGLIDKFTENNLEKKNLKANSTLEYIDNQLANISGSLGASEQQLQNFKRSQDMMDIDQKSSTLLGQMRTLENRRDVMENRLLNFENIKVYFLDTGDSSELIIPSLTGTSDATLVSLVAELTTLNTEKENLVSTNQLLSPRMRTIEANITAILKVIRENIKFNIQSISAELDEVNKRISKLNREYGRLPQAQRQLIGLQREYDLNDAVYSSLMERRIQAQIIMASNVSDYEVLEPVKYTETTNPSIKKIGMISIFLGMLFPGLFVIFKGFLSPKVRSKEEMKRLSKLPFIGSVPHNDSKHANVIKSHALSPISESFHTIRSSVVYYLMGDTNKVVLTTSSNPGEGKSFISMNLASSFATTNYKTVLVNLDLRKKNKQFASLYENEPLVGLSSYLINRASIHDIILKSNIENLDLIQNTDLPPNPVNLLTSKKLRELFDYLRKHYDYIFVDSPPFGVVADSFLLMEHTDLTVYVSRAGYTMKKMLRQSVEEIETKKIENVYQLYNDTGRIDKPYEQKYAYTYSSQKNQGFLSRIFRRRA